MYTFGKESEQILRSFLFLFFKTKEKMNKTQHKEALNALKNVKSLSLEKQYFTDKDTVKIEYKHQLIELDNGMTLIVSGSMTQFNQIHCTTEQLFLVISLLDQNNHELTFTPKQHNEFKNELRTLMTS